MPKKCLIAGIGINDSSGDVKNNPHYIKWSSMLYRCYMPSSARNKINYADVTVCEDWLKFSEFEAWSKTNYVEGLHLDKDILLQGNKVYSPETCAYVPRDINNLLLKRERGRGEYPLGVSKMTKSAKMVNDRNNPFIAKIVENANTKNLGYFINPYDAHKAWQWEKANQIEKAVAWYATQDCFRTNVADALTQRVWQLRLDHNSSVETISL